MIKQDSVKKVRGGILTRKDGYLIAAMCIYPRALPKPLLDEYLAALAPDRKLLADWKQVEAEEGHDQAFLKTQYEKRFQITDKLKYHLSRVAELAKTRDVILLCQCDLGERCHREMMMLMAQQKYGATIDKVFHEYPEFMARI